MDSWGAAGGGGLKSVRGDDGVGWRLEMTGGRRTVSPHHYCRPEWRLREGVQRGM